MTKNSYWELMFPDAQPLTEFYLRETLGRPHLRTDIETQSLCYTFCGRVSLQTLCQRTQPARRAIPKGPSRTKNTTESKFRYGEEIRYEGSKTLRRGLRHACVSRKKEAAKRYRQWKTTAVAKYYGFGRRSIFSTERSSKQVQILCAPNANYSSAKKGTAAERGASSVEEGRDPERSCICAHDF